MGAADNRVHDSKDTLELIRQKSVENDAFTVKVWRRKHMALQPEQVATLTGAIHAHFANPELWVPQLCGGGNLHLQAFHSSDPNKAVGGVVMLSISNVDPKEVDLSAPTKGSWQGPAEIIFPLKPEPRAELYGTQIHSPPGPVVPDSASSANPRYARSPGGGVSRVEYGDDPNYYQTPRGLAQVEVERRKLEEEKLQAERDRAKERLESQQKAHEAEMRSFRAEMMAELKANKAPTGPDPMVELMKQQAEDRRAAAVQAAEDRRATEAQRAEDRRAAEAERRAADERFMKLMEKLTDRPKENPLEMVAKVAEILHKGNSNEVSMKMMHNMAEMHSVQMDTAMNFIEHAANLQMGGQEGEPGWVKGLESVVKSVGAMAKGVTVKRPVPPQPQQLPQQTYEQQAQQQPQQQVPVQNFPKPPAPAAPKAPPPSVFQQFLNAIMQAGTDKELPVAQITTALLNNLTDPSLIEAFASAGNDSDVLFDKYLNNWANIRPTNREYLNALKVEIEKQFRAAGIIGSEEEGGEEEEEEGQDLDEDAGGEEQQEEADEEAP